MALKNVLPLVAGVVSAVVGVSASTIGGGISGVSWGAQRIDLFGTDAKDNIFHKYFTAFGWGPNDPAHGNLEIFGDAHAESAVSVASWAANRLDFVFVDNLGAVKHKYWDGSSWGPGLMNGFETLGTGLKGKLAINSWGPDRFDVVGLAQDGTYVHKAWTGSDYYPPGLGWESFGGLFASEPATVSWGKNRLDVFGVSKEGDVLHKFWVGDQWIPGGQEFESLGGLDKSFGPSVVATSMHEGRFDIWTVSSTSGELYHKFWDGYSYQGWENLGGNFTTTPQVNHWASNRIDIVGKDASDGSYQYKFWDGYKWHDWAGKGGSFSSEPVIVSVAPNNLNIFGLDKKGKLQIQVWDGSQWLPGFDGWTELGSTAYVTDCYGDDDEEESDLSVEDEQIFLDADTDIDDYEDEQIFLDADADDSEDVIKIELKFRA